MKKLVLFFVSFLIVFSSYSQEIKTIQKGNILVFQVSNVNRVNFGPTTEAGGDLLFVLGGPSFGRNGKPIGAIAQRGDITKGTSQRRLNKQNSFVYYNSIFGVNIGGSPVMVRQEDAYAYLPEMEWAFQNGPSLLVNGVVPDLRRTHIPNISEKTYFSGIGYKKNGEIVVLVTLRKMTIKQFSFAFKDEECINALLVNKGSGVFYSMNNSLYRKSRGSRARQNFGKSTGRFNFLFYN